MSKKNKDVGIAEIIRARRLKLQTREGYKSLLLRIVMLSLAAYIIFTQVFLITQNRGLGMFPALKDGDLIIAYRLQQEYAKNDVVVYEVNGKKEVGRIVASEYDEVVIEENGTLRVNGTVQSGEILYPTYSKEGIKYPYSVPKGHVFFLGDYRTNTKDSRDYGSISKADIDGKVISILRRRGL